jgi:hypothetical protein
MGHTENNPIRAYVFRFVLNQTLLDALRTSHLGQQRTSDVVGDQFTRFTRAAGTIRRVSASAAHRGEVSD